MRTWQRLGRSLSFGALVALISFAALPKKKVEPLGLGELREDLGGLMRKLSLAERWGMYAPDASRSHGYPIFIARYADGREEVLPESARAESGGWDRTWFGDKTRMDIFLHQVSRNPKNKGPDRNRVWFVRGLCAREWADAKGPYEIEVYRAQRRFRPPDKARKSGKVFTKIKEAELGKVYCVQSMVREMVQDRYDFEVPRLSSFPSRKRPASNEKIRVGGSK